MDAHINKPIISCLALSSVIFFHLVPTDVFPDTHFLFSLKEKSQSQLSCTLLRQEVPQRSSGVVIFESAESTHPETAACIVGGFLGWNMPIFYDWPQLHDSHFAVVSTTSSQNSKSAKRLKKVGDS